MLSHALGFGRACIGLPLHRFLAPSVLRLPLVTGRALLVVELIWVVGVSLVSIPLMLLSELVGGQGPHPVGIVFLGVGLVAFFVVRMGVRFYAAWRAWKGDIWLVPVVGLISRRWLPPTDDA